MATEHTPGKLTTNGAVIRRIGDGMPIGMADDYAKSREEQRANAQRLAHCWNVHDDMLKALRRAALALAFAAESSAAMKDDYEAVSAAIAQATEAAS